MTSIDPALVATPPAGVPTGPSVVATATHAVFDSALDLTATLEADEIDGKILRAVTRFIAADGASLWLAKDDGVACSAAVGGRAKTLVGSLTSPEELLGALPSEESMAVLTASLSTAGGALGLLRLTRAEATGGAFSEVEREMLERLASAGGIALGNAQRVAARDRAPDLALVMEMSREIASTLDLDRVMRSVVNLAMRAVPFDRGAIALYERGTCDIRAVAGAETVDRDDPELKDLAVRAAWAAGIGQSFYLSDRSEPASDAERTFLHIFGDDLAQDGVASGLYIPLKDDEGVVGILVLESARPDFATPRQHELATILANQATVALRNAQLYNQVPLADALSALHARKEAFLALPGRRRVIMAAAIVVAIGALTLIRWPLRVDGHAPVFRPTVRAEIRPLTDGIIERVFVREGAVVVRGAPIVQLRDAELRAEHQAAVAAVAAAERAAASAADRGDAAEERLQRMRAEVLRQEAAVRDEHLRAATVRAPVTGVVLSPRPAERVGSWADAGAPVLIIGRTDTLELEFGVDQRDVGRLHVGDEVRLRVDAFPQRTFAGRVSALAAIGSDSTGIVRYPVRAVVPNTEAMLRPGMVAYARVLTAPSSVMGRALREPARRLRLLWWRMWS